MLCSSDHAPASLLGLADALASSLLFIFIILNRILSSKAEERRMLVHPPNQVRMLMHSHQKNMMSMTLPIEES